MISYFPIECGIAMNALYSDLLSFDWQEKAADFRIYRDPDHVLRVTFNGDVIARILDEFPLSIEADHTMITGLVAHHFAYRVEGAAFAEQQSATWKEVIGPVTHFQFVTGSGCLDVLAAASPTFSVVSHANTKV